MNKKWIALLLSVGFTFSAGACSLLNGDSQSSSGEDNSAKALEIPDFVVDVPADRNPIVLQLTDTQIIDAGQARPGRGGVDYVNWATDQVEERCYDFLTEVINATTPDLIILTGDIIYGEFDDSGSALLSFVEFMESFQTPWAPIFGNHDNESKMGVDWQCQQFEEAEYCLFKQKELTGNGNYSVGIAQEGKLKRVFYMLDSNGCGNASEESMSNSHFRKGVGFGADQIKWYTEEITEIKALSPATKISFAYHIQTAIFNQVFAEYGDVGGNAMENPINVDTHPNKKASDFGYIGGRGVKGEWDDSYIVWDSMSQLGVDSIFVGHEHRVSASIVASGVRFQFGQKSSEYDTFNCIDGNGKITGSSTKTGTSLIGGTVIPLSKDNGSIVDPYIYYCGFENGQIDWTKYN